MVHISNQKNNKAMMAHGNKTGNIYGYGLQLPQEKIKRETMACAVVRL